jgi:hypothetical protein
VQVPGIVFKEVVATAVEVPLGGLPSGGNTPDVDIVPKIRETAGLTIK